MREAGSCRRGSDEFLVASRLGRVTMGSHHQRGPRPSAMRRPLIATSTAIFLLGLFIAPVAAAPSVPQQAPESPSAALSNGQVQLQLIASGLTSPIGVVNAGDGTNRLFVIQQNGIVKVVSGNRVTGNFLDIRGVSGGLSTGGERGLLGLAFHPNFETNEKLFVYYTRGD